MKAQTVAGSKTAKEARREYDIGSGYLCALYDAGIFDRATFTAGADLLKAAYREAEKKTALDGSNIGSGSKGGHPAKDDSSTHNQSVDEKSENVKVTGATDRELAYMLYKLIRSMQYARISDTQIVSTLLNTLRPQEGGGSIC